MYSCSRRLRSYVYLFTLNHLIASHLHQLLVLLRVYLSWCKMRLSPKCQVIFSSPFWRHCIMWINLKTDKKFLQKSSIFSMYHWCHQTLNKIMSVSCLMKPFFSAPKFHKCCKQFWIYGQDWMPLYFECWLMYSSVCYHLSIQNLQ